MTSSPTGKPGTGWRKSSRSQGGSGNCVETAHFPAHGILIRDSKNPDERPLALAPGMWRVLVTAIKDNQYDL
ncbi:DUF397 domain-containing protein [Actinomadura hibisca]|uniref:DUF397 domain-containing protein n=1 Tax=Actinomadura hibisca TaxID=68565 RepID=UPI00082CB6F8|nr:DUF397 domain-containing protein [Actinomadura hibisca]